MLFYAFLSFFYLFPLTAGRAANGADIRGVAGDGITTADRHFESDAVQSGIIVFIVISDLIFDPVVTVFVGNFSKVDSGFHRFNQAKKQFTFPVLIFPIFE
jgi:hypothetical protein